jgi:hypothetical protein
MKSIFAAMVAVAFIAGAVPASAAGARGGSPGGGAVGHGTVGHGTMGGGLHLRGARVAPPPTTPDMQSRIPAQLPEPARPPAINGPLTPNGMPSMGNGLR